MPRTALILLLAGALLGCASQSGNQAAGGPEGGGRASPPPRMLTSQIGTPFYAAFKLPVCAVSLAVAAPVAGLMGLAHTEDSFAYRQELDRDVHENCDAPYELVP
jgi:hypothetical protein